MSKADTNPGWINTSVLVGAGLFIFALFLSAVFDHRIRLLHVLQALIYIAVIVLTRKTSAWGFGAGCVIALFWNYINLFVTTFFRAGLQQLSILLQTGQLHRPDLLIAVIAVAGHFLLITACLAGFLRTRPGSRAWAVHGWRCSGDWLFRRDHYHHRTAIRRPTETSIPVVDPRNAAPTAPRRQVCPATSTHKNYRRLTNQTLSGLWQIVLDSSV